MPAVPAKPAPEPRLLDDAQRLASLARTDLLDSPAEAAFDRLTRLVTRSLGVEVSLVSLVDDRRQFFKSATGLGEPWAAQRGTPLSHSFCQHVVTADAPLVVTDARQDERVADNGAVEDLAVIGYLGVPVHGPGGLPIGSLCAISHAPRQWLDGDLMLLEDLASILSEVIGARAVATEHQAAEVELSHRLRSSLTALQLEVEEATQELPGGTAVALLRSALAAHSAVLTAALGGLAGGAGAEPDVDVLAVLERVAAAARPASPSQRVVVAPYAGQPALVRLPTADLHRVVGSVVDLLLLHGRGDVTLALLLTDGAVRVRAQDQGQGLPQEATWALTGRTDGGGADGSLAQRAVRTLGARLVLVASSPSTVDLVLPRSPSRPTGVSGA